jgi:hypothetical protein
MIPWSERKFKETSRRMASSFSPRESAFTLPGNEAADVMLAEKMGMVSKKTTHWYFAEKNQQNAAELKQVLARTGWDKCSTLHEGWLHTMKLPQPLDYVHIDLNGTITTDVGRWINGELSDHLKPGCVFCVTQEFCWRYNKWIRGFREEVINKFLPVYNDFRFKHLLIGKSKIDYYLTFPPFLVACLLRNWRLSVLKPYRYFDTVDMVLFRFIAHERQTPCLPNPFGRTQAFCGLFVPFSPLRKEPVMAKKKSKAARSAAANKAWATRRENDKARQEKLSKVAPKAAATKRKNKAKV